MSYRSIIRASYSKKLNKTIRYLNSFLSVRPKVIKYLNGISDELWKKAVSLDVDRNKRQLEKVFLTVELAKLQAKKAYNLGILNEYEAIRFIKRMNSLKARIKREIKHKEELKHKKQAEKLAEQEVVKRFGKDSLKSMFGQIAKQEFIEKYADKLPKPDKTAELNKLEASAKDKLRQYLAKEEVRSNKSTSSTGSLTFGLSAPLVQFIPAKESKDDEFVSTEPTVQFRQPSKKRPVKKSSDLNKKADEKIMKSYKSLPDLKKDDIESDSKGKSMPKDNNYWCFGQFLYEMYSRYWV